MAARKTKAERDRIAAEQVTEQTAELSTAISPASATELDLARALVGIADDAAQRGFEGYVIDLDLTKSIGHISLDDVWANRFRKGGTAHLPVGTVEAADGLMARGRVNLSTGHIVRFASQPRWPGWHWISASISPPDTGIPVPAPLEEVTADGRP